MQHVLRRRTVLPLEQEEVFRFFADARNLGRITPPELGFEILTEGPLRMEAGLRIDYRIRLFGFPLRWRTLISVWDPPHRFVDEQVRGPYREWIHTHDFASVPEGTEITDEVRYRLPLPPLGDLAYPLVRRQLERIFDHRERAIRSELRRAHGG